MSTSLFKSFFMTRKTTRITFGEEVEGYSTPVLNEREIRAAAGILFLLLFASLMQVLFRQNYLPVKYTITLFLTDLLLRVGVSPRFSPFLVIAAFIVRKQAPEYVGAAQKKFAWKIGTLLVGLVFIHLVLLNAYSNLASITCFICLSFLFFESAFGICIGCILYTWLNKRPRYCAGNTCTTINPPAGKQQGWRQAGILFAFLLYIAVLLLWLQPFFTPGPQPLF